MHLGKVTHKPFCGFLNFRKIHFDKGPNGIGKISFELPNGKVNVLSLKTLNTFEELLNQAKASDIKALVIKITNGAGADLREIRQGLDDPALLEHIVKTGHRVFSQLANFPVPTIAFIDQACLGGKAELAVSCTYRVVTDDPKTKIGFPEVKLGIFPCWGGTQRLPRLVGGPQALNMIMNGEPVSAPKAREIQLADAIFAREFFEEEGLKFVEFCLTPEGEKQVSENRKKISLPAWPGFSHKNTTPGLIACHLIYASNEVSLHDGIKMEREVFLKMPTGVFAEANTLISTFLDKKGTKE